MAASASLRSTSFRNSGSGISLPIAIVVAQAVISTIATAPTTIVISPPRWANDGGLRNSSRHPATKAAKAVARSGGTRISLIGSEYGVHPVVRPFPPYPPTGWGVVASGYGLSLRPLV